MQTPPARRRLDTGTAVPRQLATSVSGHEVPLTDRDRLTHLQFRRFAGCPVCNLHLRSFAHRHDELTTAGIRELVVFHSSPDALAPHTEGLPFEVVADPAKRLYQAFGVESSPRALLDPRAWPMIVRAVFASLYGIVRGTTRAPRLRPHGGRFGLPADFLIGTDGRLIASHYGTHVDDHWEVDDVLRLAAQLPTPQR